MSLTLKTNRTPIIKFLLPIFAIISFFFVLIVIAFITHYEDMKNQLFALVTISSMEGIFVVSFICTKLLFIKRYTFDSEHIQVYSGKKQTEQIGIENIIYMKYKVFHFKYIFTIFSGDLHDGGCWRLYLHLSNGRRIALDFFDKKEVYKIKELYGELVQIS